jgi:hypothetical protein
MFTDAELEIFEFHRTCWKTREMLVEMFGLDTVESWRDMGDRTDAEMADAYYETADEIECGFNFGEDAV